MDAFLKSEVNVRETRRNGDGIPEDYWGKLLVPWQVQALSGINGTMVILPGVKSVKREVDFLNPGVPNPAAGDITIVLDGKNSDVKWDPIPPPPPPNPQAASIDLLRQIASRLGYVLTPASASKPGV